LFSVFRDVLFLALFFGCFFAGLVILASSTSPAFSRLFSADSVLFARLLLYAPPFLTFDFTLESVAVDLVRSPAETAIDASLSFSFAFSPSVGVASPPVVSALGYGLSFSF